MIVTPTPSSRTSLSAVSMMVSSLSEMRWPRPAIACWRRSLQAEADYPEALYGLGASLMTQGREQMQLAGRLRQDGKPVEADFARNRAREDWAEAERLLQRLLALRPDYPRARVYLQWVRGQLSSLAAAGGRR